ncbi:serine-rich adhesin for platelets-like isoform X2 [Diabrotica virgifera virgifera]|nr:serine-rich adhesin for platelets-like isoform X2 [Diabrotica virgifera virgifera]
MNNNYQSTKHVKYDQPLFHPGAEEKESMLFTDDSIHTESPVYIPNIESNIRDLKTDIENIPQETITTWSPWNQIVKNTGTASKNSVFNPDLKEEKQLFQKLKSTIDHTLLHNTESTKPLTENHFQQTVQNVSAQSTNIIEHTLSNTLATDRNATQITLPYTKPEPFIPTEISTNIIGNVTDYSQNVTTLTNDQQSSSSIINRVLPDIHSIQLEKDTTTGSENSSVLQNIIDTVSSTETYTESDTLSNDTSNTENNSASYLRDIFSSASKAQKEPSIPTENSTISDRVTDYLQNITTESTTLNNDQESTSSTINRLLQNFHNTQVEKDTTNGSKNSTVLQNVIDSVSTTEPYTDPDTLFNATSNTENHSPSYSTEMFSSASKAQKESFIATENSTISDRVTDYLKNIIAESTTLNNDQESTMNRPLQNFYNTQLEKDTTTGSENSNVLQNVIDSVSTTNSDTLYNATSNTENNTPSKLREIFSLASTAQKESFIPTENSTISDRVIDYSQHITIESTALNNGHESSSSTMNRLLENFHNTQLEKGTTTGSEKSRMLQNVIDSVSTTETNTESDTLFNATSNTENNSSSYLREIFSSASKAQKEPFISTENSTISDSVTDYLQNIPAESTTLNNDQESTSSTMSRLLQNFHNTQLEKGTTGSENSSVLQNVIDSASTTETNTDSEIQNTLFNATSNTENNSPSFLREIFSSASKAQKQTFIPTENYIGTSDNITHYVQNITIESTTLTNSQEASSSLMSTILKDTTVVPNHSSMFQNIDPVRSTGKTPTTSVLETIVNQQMTTDFPPRTIPSMVQEVFSSTKPYFIETTETDSSSFQTSNIPDNRMEVLQNITAAFKEATTSTSDTEETLPTTVKHLLTDFQNKIVEQATTVSTTNSTDFTTLRDMNYSSNEMTPTTELLTTVPQHNIITHLSSSDTSSTVPTLFSSTDTYLTTTQQFSDTQFMERTAEVTKNMSSVFEDLKTTENVSTTTESVLEDQYFTPTIKNILTDLQNKSLQHTTSTKLPQFESRFGDFVDGVDVTEMPQISSILNITSEAPIFNTTIEHDPDPIFDEDRWLVYVGMGFVGAVIVLFLLSVFTYIYVRKMKKYSNYRLAPRRDTFSSVLSKFA